MSIDSVICWMQSTLERDDCLYQEDVVDYLVQSKQEDLLRENSAGNLVLEKKIVGKFREVTEKSVVWVKPERYWRFRVPEDELGGKARG